MAYATLYVNPDRNSHANEHRRPIFRFLSVGILRVQATANLDLFELLLGTTSGLTA